MAMNINPRSRFYLYRFLLLLFPAICRIVLQADTARITSYNVCYTKLLRSHVEQIRNIQSKQPLGVNIIKDVSRANAYQQAINNKRNNFV